MDTQNNAGSDTQGRQYICDFDIRGRTFADLVGWLSYVKPEGFAELVKAITQNDASLKAEILRRWGVWR